MSWRVIRTIFNKEMLETIRDRRTLLAMVGIPVLLYPLLAIGISQLVAMQMARLTKQKIRLVIVDGQQDTVDRLRADPRIEMKKAASKEQAIALLKEGEIDAVIIVDPAKNGELVRVNLLYTVTEDRSMMSRRRLSEMLRRIAIRRLAVRLKAKQLTLKKVRAMAVVTRNVNPQLSGGFTFGRMIAFMLVLLSVTFPFHPALDLAAGEKERGTLETLLVSPAARKEIVVGKYLAVFVIGLVGSMLNLGSMALTFGYFADMTKSASAAKVAHHDESHAADEKLGPSFLLDEVEDSPKHEFSIGWLALLKILMALIPLLALFSAIALMLSTLAGSYKEGQNYLTPLLVIVMPLSMVAMIPNMHLDMSNAWVPVANVVLLVKDLFIEKLDPLAFASALGFTMVYAALALWATVQVCGREDVLFREVGNTKVGLRPSRPRAVPSAAAAFVVFGIAMILIAMGNQKITVWMIKQFGIIKGLPLSLALGLALIGLLALLAVWYNRAQYAASLALRKPPAIAIVAALAIGAGGAMLFLPVVPWIIKFFPGLAKQFEQFEHLDAVFKQIPLSVQLLTMALLPAVFEELLFRGMLLQSLRRAMTPFWAIVVVSAMFAVAHQHFLRYPATFSVGLLLGWTVYRTGSVWVGVALHLAWNGSLVIISAKGAAVPLQTWAVIGAVCLTGGIVLLLTMTASAAESADLATEV